MLQVLVCLGGGGVETLLLNLQTKLPEQITFDYLVAHPDIRDKEAQALGSVIHVTPPAMQSPTRWATLVGQLVREHRYDVVHFHRFAFGGSVLKAAKQAGAAGRIAHSHGTASQEPLLKKLLYFPYHRTINRWLLTQYATHIAGCSSDALRFLMGPFATNSKCRIILNGLPVEDFANRIGSTPKAELLLRYGMPKGAPVIGNIGRFEPLKNQAFLLRIFDALLKRRRNNRTGTPALNKAVMFMGGDGYLRSKLEQDRERFSLQDKVFMPGHCPNVPELLGNLFDCFVLPSKAEGLPVSLIEAVAAGLHVVCSEVITKDVTGAFPDRITALPLSAPLERWAEAMEEAIQQRIPPEQGLERVRHSPLVFDQFAEEMMKMYMLSMGEI